MAYPPVVHAAEVVPWRHYLPCIGPAGRLLPEPGIFVPWARSWTPDPGYKEPDVATEKRSRGLPPEFDPEGRPRE